MVSLTGRYNVLITEITKLILQRAFFIKNPVLLVEKAEIWRRCKWYIIHYLIIITP
jgi:hypothetical protein